MIYSPSRKLLFIHIQRTGGTSLSRLLLESIPDAKRIGIAHTLARDARAYIGNEQFNDCYRFAFVRNPWDRMVSWFERGKVPGTTIAKRFNIGPATTFGEFLANRHARLFTNQIDFLTDGNGRMLVVDVFRFENYLDGVQAICKGFGIDASKLPHETPSKHAHYSTYYNDTTRRIVEQRFSRDIAQFGYTFETQP